MAPSHQQSWPSCHAGNPATSVMRLWSAFGGCLSSASCIMTSACCGLAESSQATQKGSGTQHMACKGLADQHGHKHHHVNALPELCCLHCAQQDHSRLRGRLCMAGFARTSNRAHFNMCSGSVRVIDCQSSGPGPVCKAVCSLTWCLDRVIQGMLPVRQQLRRDGQMQRKLYWQQ